MKKENGIFLQEYFKKGFIEVREDGNIWLSLKSMHKKARLNKGGYLVMSIDNKRFPVHQIVWVWHRGIVPDGYEIDHLDNNKLNNSVWNLNLLTPEQNYTKQALLVRGTGNASCKLTESDVLEIRKRAAAGESAGTIAKDYPVARTQIARIIQRERWAWLP